MKKKKKPESPGLRVTLLKTPKGTFVFKKKTSNKTGWELSLAFESKPEKRHAKRVRKEVPGKEETSA